MVYVKGKPFAINKKNKIVVDTIYSKIEKFENGFARVCSKNNLWGIIDSMGKEIIKPMLVWGIFFENDYAIIRKPIKKNSFDCYYAAMNNKCQIVVPFGKYVYLQYIGNDMFFAQRKDGNRIIVNKSGKVFFEETNSITYDINSNFNNGLAFLRVTEKPNTQQEHSYSAIVDTSGHIIFKDTIAYGTTTSFVDNYAFAQLNDDLFWAINKNGEKKLVDSIESIDEVKSSNCFIYKNKNGLFGIIGVDANIIIKAKFDWLSFNEKNNKIDFSEYVNDTIDKIGFCDSKGNIEYIDKSFNNLWGYTNNGFVYDNNNDTISLYNNQYQMVWQTALHTDSVSFLNIDLKYRTSYVQQRKDDKNADPNFYYFGDTIKPFSFNNEKNKVSIKLLTNTTDTFINSFYCRPLYLFNNTSKDFNYLSIDFEAPVILQAKNEKGIWQDIARIREYLGHNQNTYMKSTLRPHSYLKFPIPIFEGSFKTKLRVAFEYAIRDDKKYYYQWQTKRLYSNEMDISINPSQFYYDGKFLTDNRLGDLYEDFICQ